MGLEVGSRIIAWDACTFRPCTVLGAYAPMVIDREYYCLSKKFCQAMESASRRFLSESTLEIAAVASSSAKDCHTTSGNFYSASLACDEGEDVHCMRWQVDMVVAFATNSWLTAVGLGRGRPMSWTRWASCPRGENGERKKGRWSRW